METAWSNRYAERTQRMKSSAIRELLKLTEKPDVISFAGGLPAPDVFPTEAFEQAAHRVLEQAPHQALQYSTTEGYGPLREMIARHTARYGIEVGPNNILITSGSQQALDLIGKVFLNPGDHVVVESPTYLGALQAWNAYQAQYLSVPLDESGMQTIHLEAALRNSPKFIYALPNFHNPAGVTLSRQRRLELIELADTAGVPIVEDDPYGQLRYSGEHIPPIAILDESYHSGGGFEGNVIYLSTFSKTLAPGLRLGWVIAPATVIKRLVQAKQGADLHTSSFTQMVAYETARGGFLDRHVRTIREVYRERRDVMLQAMDAHFPDDVTWTRPEGGLFLWVTLPERFVAADVLELAVTEENVAFVPGDAFSPDGGCRASMRLNFSYAPPEVIEEGIARLGRLLHRLMNRQGTKPEGSAVR